MQPEKVIYTNSLGRSITLTSSRPFILESAEGKGDVGASIQMQSTTQSDGALYIDTILSTRPITLNVNISVDSRDELNKARQDLAAVFNPKLGKGTLVYSNGLTTRKIEVVVDGIPSFPVGNKGRWWQQATVNLIAPKPHWLNAVTENVKLQDFVAGFHFPFHFPVSFAIRGDKRTLHNGGDVPAPVKVTFRGNTVNPTVRNITTGDFIKVNFEIPDGYTFVVDTENKTVKMYDGTGTSTNMFRYLDSDSTFFDLVLGDNDISFSTDGGEPEVYIEFTERYGAV